MNAPRSPSITAREIKRLRRLLTVTPIGYSFSVLECPSPNEVALQTFQSGLNACSRQRGSRSAEQSATL